MKYLIFFLVIPLLCSCLSDDDCHDQLLLVNNSTETIWTGFGKGNSEVFECGVVTGSIEANDTYIQYLRCWEESIRGSLGGSLVVYYFSEMPNSTADNCNEDELNNLIIERKEFTLEELNAINWTISYP